jgi:hypothetical protein
VFEVELGLWSALAAAVDTDRVLAGLYLPPTLGVDRVRLFVCRGEHEVEALMAAV